VCRSAQLVRIGISINGDDVRMHSCSKCETRWWERNGDQIDLDGVLDMAATTRR
jgi:hypothetical protein